GRAVPLVAALLVPLVALGLYLHWGASDKVELAREFAQAPHSMEEMTARLERAVQAQPDSAQGWYFLGRTYMTQERGADAARAFERAAELSGRQPEVLGQWAQALYFSGGKKMTAQIKALADEALKGDPAEVTTLGLLGIAAFEEQRYADAIGFWERLVSVLPNEDPARSAIQGGIQRARESMM
ncbi:c-type cytochrome biogenesis protein, partial [Pseudomonas aeruginosa]|nr:c-type cytochrome biogenesis protein [Pseudomonas aeruginosa]